MESSELYIYNKTMCWVKLIPAATLIVVIATLSPSFALACAGVSLLLSINLIIEYIGKNFISSKLKKEYYDLIFNQQLMITLGLPLIEECLFRGIILPVLLFGLGCFCPPVIIFTFLPLSIAAMLAILISSFLFGLVHTFNAEDQNHLQVLCTFLMGLYFGYLYLQFGLMTAIGAHILNNTLACIIIYSQFENADLLGYETPRCAC